MLKLFNNFSRNFHAFFPVTCLISIGYDILLCSGLDAVIFRLTVFLRWHVDVGCAMSAVGGQIQPIKKSGREVAPVVKQLPTHL